MTPRLFRMRVAVLWVAVAIAMAGSLLLYLFVPGALEEMLAGEMEGDPERRLGLRLRSVGDHPRGDGGGDAASRRPGEPRPNLIAGLAVGLFGFYPVVSEVLAGDFNGHVLMAAVAGALAFLIAGLGLVDLREPTSPTAARGSEQSRPSEKVTV